MPEPTKFYANGVNATTGQYGLEPMTEDQLLNAIKGAVLLPDGEKNYLDSKNKQTELREKYKELGGLEAQLGSATDTAEITAKIEKCKAQIEDLEHLGTVAHIDPIKLDETGWGIIFAKNADPAIRATLRAANRVTLDGDTVLCVPQDEDGDIDTELWAIHTEAVRQAQAGRAELVKTAIEAGTSLFNLFRPG